MNVGRNDPCPCGSGNKYKKCCFAKDEAARAERAALAATEAAKAPEAVKTHAARRTPTAGAPPRQGSSQAKKSVPIRRRAV